MVGIPPLLNEHDVDDDTVRPVQFHPQRDWTPTQRLCLAILEDVAACLTRPPAGLITTDQFPCDWEWIHQDVQYPFSFTWVCQVLGMSPAVVRRGFERMVTTGAFYHKTKDRREQKKRKCLSAP